METLTIFTGDCVKSMRSMKEQSIDCCVTSPPYYGLRDYGHDGQIGLEETPKAYIEKMVEVFREVKRVLKDDGTLWLNIGDSYASSNDGSKPQTGMAGLGRQGGKEVIYQSRRKMEEGLKPKDLIGIPWMLAFALRSDGWYLRQDIIWHKPNPMPESVTDRCTKAHEYIFLLSKSERYFYNNEAIKEPAKNWGTRDRKPGSAFVDGTPGRSPQSGGKNCNFEKSGRNKRSVWTVNTKPYKGAHFATFPPDLIRPCIKACCRPDGTVLDPFGGSGTTGQVSLEEGRRAVLCELNPEYAELAKQRCGILQTRMF